MKKVINVVAVVVVVGILAVAGLEARTLYVCGKIVSAAEEKQAEYFRKYDEECTQHIGGDKEKYAECVSKLVQDLNNSVDVMETELEKFGCTDEE
jgi:hypothetical protein